MSLIDASQQFDIGASVALRKTMTAVDENLDLAAPPVTRDQTRHLRPAAARHLLQVTAHQSPLPTAELMVVLLAEHLLDPAILLGLGFSASCTLVVNPQHATLLQAHLVLESRSPLRLILYWIRLHLAPAPPWV